MNSKKMLICLTVFYISSLIFFRSWGNFILENGDSYGYYNYLPAFFIHHDLIDAEGRKTAFTRFKNHTDYANRDFTPESMDQSAFLGTNFQGRWVNSYTYGVALLQTPLFLVAHVSAKPLGFKADGFSLPYRAMATLSGCLYGLLGLFFLRKILRGYFDEMTTSITLLIVGAATNLYYFSTYNPFMSHNHLFCLVAILTWATMQFYTRYERQYLFTIAFLSGLIAIMRPTDVLFLVIPFFYKVHSWSTLKARVQLIARQKMDFLIALPLFFLPILPQLFYWKMQTNQWFFNSYGDALRFDFRHPEIIKGLFYFQNGWLAYTPVMALAVLGMAFLFKKRDFLTPILLFFPVYVFVIYSWWCWNYINGFGSRPMIDAYALLAIPLSMSVDFIRRLPIWGRIPLFFLLGLFGCLNIWQTEQSHLGTLRSEEGSLVYVWNILFKKKLDYSALVAFDAAVVQPSNPIFMRKMYENTFEDSTASPRAIRQNMGNGLVSYEVPAGGFSASYKGKISDFEGAKWVRVSVKAFSPENYSYQIYRKSALVVAISRDGMSIDWQGVRLENKLGEADKLFGGKTKTWGEVSYFIQLPSDALPTDDVSCVVWCNNIFPIIIDDLKVEAFK